MPEHHHEPQDAGDRADAREIDDAATQIAHQLQERGVRAREDDPAEELARLLDAVEHFERVVAARGGDSYVNSPLSSNPERPDFVVPRRRDDESAASYTARVREAAERLA